MIFTPEQKMQLANDAARQISEQLAAAIPVALVGMIEQVDEHVSLQIQRNISESVFAALAAQRDGFAQALREIRKLSQIGPARGTRVWDALDALLRKLEAS
jgi:hypothetical protein